MSPCFPLLRPTSHSFSPLWVKISEFGWCLKRRGLTNVNRILFARMCNFLSHDIGSSVCARHLIHVSCACVFDLSSTLSSHSSFVSPIFHFILLNIVLPFPLPCGCCRSKIPCALRPMRSLAFSPTTLLTTNDVCLEFSCGVCGLCCVLI